jgi:transposase
MIPGGLKILLALEPIDMRRSIDGLVVAVAERLKKDAASDRALYVFANLRRDRIKVLWRDATGWCLLYKRLEGARATLPEVDDGAVSVHVEARILASILDGTKKRPTVREIVREAREKVAAAAPISKTRR